MKSVCPHAQACTVYALYNCYWWNIKKEKKKKRLGQVFMQERKEPEDLVRSSSGVAIQGLLLLTYVGFWFSFLPLKTLKQSGMVPMRHELV